MTEEEIEKQVEVIRRYREIGENYAYQFMRGLLTLDELEETLTAVIKQRDKELETGEEIAWDGYWQNDEPIHGESYLVLKMKGESK